MSDWDKLRKASEKYRESYPKGTRIELQYMGEDPDPVPEGTRGSVVGVDDACQIMMKWDNGRSLSIVPGIDYAVKIIM